MTMTQIAILALAESMKDPVNDVINVKLDRIKEAINELFAMQAKGTLVHVKNAHTCFPPLGIPLKRMIVDVVPTAEGDWKVETRGDLTHAKTYKSKVVAVREGKKRAKASGLGQIVVHGTDGKIQYENTYGHDPVGSIG